MINNRTGAAAERRRLLVLASTFPASRGDGTPGFVADLAAAESEEFETLVVVPRVRGAARREVRDGYRVERFAYFPRKWEDLADGAILENLRARPSRWLQVLPFLAAEVLATARAVRQHRPDVVHVHWVIPQGVAALIGARRVPWLVTTLGGDLYGMTGRAAVSLKRRVLQRAAFATAMNEDMRQTMIALGANAERTFVLPMGADVAAVRARTGGTERMASAMLFVGRLVEKKGAAVLLQALHQIPDDIDWTLEIVGDGPLRQEIDVAARALGGRVRLLGQATRAELFDAYARASVVVVPSVRAASGDQDGLPVALLEAMAAGCAIVASRLPGIAHAVVDGSSGVLVEPGDVAQLAGALTGVLRDGELRGRLAAGAAARADEFSLPVIGQKYRDLLSQVVRQRPDAP